MITAIALVIGVVAIGAIAFGQLGGGGAVDDLRRPVAPYPDALTDGSSLGDEGAAVTMVVYADYQCSVCGRYATEVEPLLVDRYVRDGTLRIEHRDVAILGRGGDNESQLAAAAASCAEQQGEFFAYHDWLYANIGPVNSGAFTRDRLRAIADAVGLDRPAFDTCLDDPATRAAVDQATAEFSSRGFNATPSMIIGTQSIVGLQSADELGRIIEAQAAASAAPSP
jgi:protein-disulfide isomerase